MKTDQNSFDAIVPIPGNQQGIMLGIQTTAECVTQVKFLPTAQIKRAPKESIASQAMQQLTAYFSSPDWHFDLPVQFLGTEFQIRVWRVLRNIKPGETTTYGDVAAKLDSSPRAVGNACGRNPLPIIVPCHRVVAKSGVGGFSRQREGSLVDLKQWLLQRERTYAN